jgi:predicted MFS family arabinose efflux permease
MTVKPPAAAPPSAAPYGYSLGLLTTIYVFNFLDRQVMTILAEPIKRELHLHDWQLGVMTGLAFALLYTIVGFPIARLAERGDRSRIIAVAVLVWSAFTMVCGLAQSFVQLVLARVGVGVGEAGLSPPAQSLISEIVPREKRASAMALYSLGPPLGQILGVATGGLIASIWGWRTAFLIAGGPGIVLAVLAATTLKEPRRSQPREAARDVPPLRAMARLLAAKRSFWLLAFGAAAKAFITYGQGAFMASFFLRVHGAELATLAADLGLKPIGFLGLTLGLAGGAAGIFGSIGGGRLADRWVARDLSAFATLPAICALAAMPFLVGALLVGSFWPSILLFCVSIVLNAAWLGPVNAAVQGLVHPRSRATAAAALLFVINLVGLGLGPICVGLTSDLLAGPGGLGSAEGLRWALVGATSISLVATALFWSAREPIRHDTIS